MYLKMDLQVYDLLVGSVNEGTTSSIKVNRNYILLWTFNAAEIVPFPDLWLNTILSWRSTDNSLGFMARFVLWHEVLPVGHYRDRCLPFQIISNQLNLPQVDSNQFVETSQGWSVESGMHLSSILSVMAKTVNITCAFLFFIN